MLYDTMPAAKGNAMILVDATIKNWKVTTKACPIGRTVCSGKKNCGHFDGWHGPDDGEIEVCCLAKEEPRKEKP